MKDFEYKLTDSNEVLSANCSVEDAYNIAMDCIDHYQHKGQQEAHRRMCQQTLESYKQNFTSKGYAKKIFARFIGNVSLNEKVLKV